MSDETQKRPEPKEKAVEAAAGTNIVETNHAESAPADKAAAKKPDSEKPSAPARAAGAAKPAARAAKALPPPDPRAEEAKAEAEKVAKAIAAAIGTEVVDEVGNAHFNPMVRVKRDAWLQVVDLLKTHPDWQLNYIECMAGTDYPDYIEIVTYIQSTTLGHFVCLKTRTPRDAAEVPSLVSTHPGVNWEEREIFDLLGVRFTKHPDLRRIMMWDEFVGHPLRKDYNEWDGGDEHGAD